MFKVYLAGPITGLSYGSSTDWRAHAKQKLFDMSAGYGRGMDIIGYSPMRGKEYLRNEKTITDGSYNTTIMSNDHSIVARDSNDCYTADAILVNLLGVEKVSIGTVLEIGMAYRRCPIVLCMEPFTQDPKPNIHEHGMIRDMVGFRCATLDEGLVTVAKILLP